MIGWGVVRLVADCETKGFFEEIRGGQVTEISFGALI
jgi:hypothetical protein